MQLDKASSYALCATVCIAQQAAGRPVQGRTVASLCDIPIEYLLKILQQLARNGVLVSERGRTGGFLLARPPDKTTLLQVVEAIQGPIRARAPGLRKVRATRPEQLIEKICVDMAEHARNRLAKLTVADLMNEN